MLRTTSAWTSPCAPARHTPAHLRVGTADSQIRSHVVWQVVEDAGDPLADLGDDMLERLASRIEDAGGGS